MRCTTAASLRLIVRLTCRVAATTIVDFLVVVTKHSATHDVAQPGLAREILSHADARLFAVRLRAHHLITAARQPTSAAQ